MTFRARFVLGVALLVSACSPAGALPLGHIDSINGDTNPDGHVFDLEGDGLHVTWSVTDVCDPIEVNAWFMALYVDGICVQTICTGEWCTLTGDTSHFTWTFLHETKGVQPGCRHAICFLPGEMWVPGEEPDNCTGHTKPDCAQVVIAQEPPIVCTENSCGDPSPCLAWPIEIAAGVDGATCVGAPIDVATGAVRYQHEDIRIEGISPVVFRRYYDSMGMNPAGDLGARWTHSFGMKLISDSGNANKIFVDERGRRIVFTQMSIGESPATPWYENPYDHLVLYYDGNWEVSSTRTYQRWLFDPSGHLTYIRDRRGFGVNISYDEENPDEIDTVCCDIPITDEPCLHFAYDENGHIEAITGPDDSVWTYDVEDDDLVAVTTPEPLEGESALTTHYDYASGRHLLETITEECVETEEEHIVEQHSYNTEDDRALTSAEGFDADHQPVNSLTLDYTGGDPNTTNVTGSVPERVTTYTYDPDTGLVSNTAGPGCGCSGSGGSVEFDKHFNKISTVDAEGRETDYTYDPKSEVLLEVTEGLPDNARTTYFRYADTLHPHLVTAIGRESLLDDTPIDPDDRDHETGAWELLTYDMYGNVETRTWKGWTVAAGSEEPEPYSYTTTYLFAAQILTGVNGPYEPESEEDPDDIVTWMEDYWRYVGTYDDLTANLPDAPVFGNCHDLYHVTCFTDRDAYGHVTAVRTPNGVVTETTYDTWGRERTRTVRQVRVVGDSTHLLPPEETTTTHYDCFGNVDWVETPGGHTWSSLFDDSHRLMLSTDPEGNKIRYTYDGDSNVTLQEWLDAEDTVTRDVRTEYDDWNRVWKVHEPADAETYTEHVYDYSGLETQVIDPMGHSTVFVYDDQRRVESVTKEVSDPLTAPVVAATTMFGYDARGNLTCVTDAESHYTEYTYDDRNRLIQVVSPDTGTSKYAYDSRDLMVQLVDGNGTVLNYTFDALGRLTQVEDGDSENVQTYAYDSADDVVSNHGIGRLASATGSGITVSWTYDMDGRVTSETMSGLPEPFDADETTSWTYDLDGNVETLTYPSDRVMTFVHDDAGQVTGITTTLAEETSPVDVVYDVMHAPFGPVTFMKYGNDSESRRGYDLTYRLASQVDSGDVIDRTLTRDDDGLLLSVDDGLLDAETEYYHYDRLHRLTYAYRMEDSGTVEKEDLSSYDLVGNRLSMIEMASVDSEPVFDETDTYTYESATDRLSEIDRSDFTTEAFTSDAAGRIETDEATTFTFDAYARLARIDVDDDPIETSVYDALGRRRYETVAGSPAREFTYDLDGKLLGAQDEDGRLWDYVYVGTMPVGEVTRASAEDDEVLGFLHSDDLDTPMARTDGTGDVTYRRWESPFGVELDSTGEPPLMNFPGQIASDGGFGRHNGARFYRPDLGRYLQPDPIGLHGGVNPFTYTAANPLTWTDALGLAVDYLPPPPPGFGPSWKVGRTPKGKWCLEDPDGTWWIAHPENSGHWRHWDIERPGSGKPHNTYPPDSKKPWPGQKKPPYGGQSPTDPNGDAPAWEPPASTVDPFTGLPVAPLAPGWPACVPGVPWSPRFLPFGEPVPMPLPIPG